jgi:hypothetical protein
VEVLIPATFRGELDVVEGDFVAVMWESLAEPIIPGREEIGLPKLFADARRKPKRSALAWLAPPAGCRWPASGVSCRSSAGGAFP